MKTDFPTFDYNGRVFVNWAESLWRSARGASVDEAFSAGPVEMDDESRDAVAQAQAALFSDESEPAMAIRDRIMIYVRPTLPWNKLSDKAREQQLINAVPNGPEIVEMARSEDVPSTCKLGAAILRVIEAAKAARPARRHSHQGEDEMKEFKGFFCVKLQTDKHYFDSFAAAESYGYANSKGSLEIWQWDRTEQAYCQIM